MARIAVQETSLTQLAIEIGADAVVWRKEWEGTGEGPGRDGRFAFTYDSTSRRFELTIRPHTVIFPATRHTCAWLCEVAEARRFRFGDYGEVQLDEEEAGMLLTLAQIAEPNISRASTATLGSILYGENGRSPTHVRKAYKNEETQS